MSSSKQHSSRSPEARSSTAEQALSSRKNAPAGSGLLPIGYLSKAHGIRGELLLTLETGVPELAGGEVFLRPRHGGALKAFTVERTRTHHGSLLVLFEGITTRNDAELLRSHTVLVSRDRLPPLDEGEVYLEDLPGLEVFVDAGEGKEPAPLGTLVRAEAPAGQILWTISTPQGGEILFPAVEAFVLEIDLERGRAVIEPPPGLLDLYLAP